MKSVVLASIVIHNLCIDNSEPLPLHLDHGTDPMTMEQRDRNAVRGLMCMHQCSKVQDTSVEA